MFAGLSTGDHGIVHGQRRPFFGLDRHAAQRGRGRASAESDRPETRMRLAGARYARRSANDDILQLQLADLWSIDLPSLGHDAGRASVTLNATIGDDVFTLTKSRSMP